MKTNKHRIWWKKCTDESTCLCTRDERSHIFQTLTPLLLHALRLLLPLRKIFKYQLRLLFTLRKLQSNSYQKVSILPHEAKCMLRLFWLWSNINGWSGHVKSTIQRQNV